MNINIVRKDSLPCQMLKIRHFDAYRINIVIKVYHCILRTLFGFIIVFDDLNAIFFSKFP